jgi:hypothetical protein
VIHKAISVVNGVYETLLQKSQNVHISDKMMDIIQKVPPS